MWVQGSCAAGGRGSKRPRLSCAASARRALMHSRARCRSVQMARIAAPQHRPAAGRRAEEKPLHLFSDVHVGQHGAGDGVGGQALPRSSGCVWPRSHQPISSDAFMRIARIRRRATRRSKSWLVVHRRRRPRCKRSKRRVASTFMTMTSASLRTSMRLRRKWPASARRSCEHWRNARMPSC